MADLTQLKFKRGQCKATITRVVNYLNSIDQNSVDESLTTQLKLRLDKLDPAFTEFSQIQSDIEYYLEINNGSLEDKQNENVERESFENVYFDLVSKITTLINNFQVKKLVSGTSLNSVASNNDLHVPQPITTKLPTLKLPTFSGSIEKWLEFRDIFLSLVHNNNQLDEIQKFYYLRSCLQGDAAQVVESIPVTLDNYDVAWTSLTDRYENKRLIVFSYVKSLFDVPVVVRENSTELRHLYDTFIKSIRSLDNLGQPTKQWDTLLIYLLVSKFDSRTRRDWEAFKIAGDLPTMQEISTFLKDKCELLEKLYGSKSDNKTENYKAQIKNKFSKNQTTHSYLSNENKKFACFYCKKDHSVFKCDKFLELSVSEREKEVQRLQLCVNCLNPNHAVDKCNKLPCKYCKKMHNTLLHAEIVAAANATIIKNEDAVCREDTTTDTCVHTSTAGGKGGSKNALTLLSTAVVNIKDKKGKIVTARMLLDPGSQSNFITEKLANSLELDKIPVKYTISGVGNNISLLSQFKVALKVMSQCNDYSNDIFCLVLPKITQAMPSCSFNLNSLKIPKHTKLADPNFNKNNEIDMLCGVSLFYDLLLMNQIKLENGLTMQNTKLGWVLGGEMNYIHLSKSNNIASYHCIDNVCDMHEINDSLIKFWQVEECSYNKIKDNFCENHFLNSFYRDPDGRFVVKIPFKENISHFGNSKDIALQRFYYLEKRLAKNINLKRQYVEFMTEYEILGHMKEVPIDINDLTDDELAYYVPHHAVLKDTSATTPCRVVFDFSAKTDKNIALNDVQYSGPVIQSELIDILLRFRLRKFIISADISKMFRQVRLNPEHTRFQRIFWRPSENDKIKCYELLTVTYGMAASSYLATRPLLQLAEEIKHKNPRISQSIRDNFYVDDYLDGENEEQDLINLQINVSKILQDAGFQLRKWLTNKPELFDNFDIDKNIESCILGLGENENNKTLGIFWNTNSDTIEFQVKSFDDHSKITKRFILSTVGQIFDPMGLVSPIIIRAKMLLQSLWKEKTSWDEPVSENLCKKWLEFVADLK